MAAVTVSLLIGAYFASLALVHSADVNPYGRFSREVAPEYVPSEIEDEIDYQPLSSDGDISDYDWSPPNGELPDSNVNAVDSLMSYFGNGDSQRVGESWIQDRSIVDKVPKDETKRGFNYPKQKKSQVLCRVQKAIHHHSEAGYEFFPKSYTSYSCHPVSPSQFEGSLSTSHDVCLVRSNKCSTLNLKRFFLKRNQTNLCWSNVVAKDVGSGCDCLYHYKYRIHL